MHIHIEVENIKCGGCAHHIRDSLNALAGVQGTQVDIDKSAVDFEADDETARDIALQRLRELGYPRVGEVEGLAGMGAKARSMVSCVIGRVTPDEKH
ncbi:MAG: heavy metal-associated domain-containing protein [Halothiobacillaceae bacterium]|nr:heavy metal-associated domain-containing protein [Halothiobacillaceae bacterium]